MSAFSTVNGRAGAPAACVMSTRAPRRHKAYQRPPAALPPPSRRATKRRAARSGDFMACTVITLRVWNRRQRPGHRCRTATITSSSSTATYSTHIHAHRPVPSAAKPVPITDARRPTDRSDTHPSGTTRNGSHNRS